NKTIAGGSYQITVGGDDGYRLSLDGGATWQINKRNDQGYTTTTYTATLGGNYNIILDFYENGGQNRVSFQMSPVCMGTENQSIAGTNNIWNAYVYDGTNFNIFKGLVHEGTTNNPAFDESFGGDNVNYNTSSCSVQTETFSVRYRLSKSYVNSTVTFVVGGDDGYRLSIDGGATWIIDNWYDQSFGVSSATRTLNGTYDLVLEYYENGGQNRISFNQLQLATLPITLESFSGIQQGSKAVLNWKISEDSNPDYFELEYSTTGQSFATRAMILADAATTSYDYKDAMSGGKNYYRLKMTDLNGKVTYSKIISLGSVAPLSSGVTLYPTILTGSTLSIVSSTTLKEASVSITDAMGKMVGKKVLGRIESGQAINFIAGNGQLARGIYFVQINDGDNKIDTKRFIVQ
ncbi:MAG TPA: T9SS type A sorting domain-containing protein, partial [Chitinophagaceae bacterium]|nr:T9SS type A sorting domain-containing protein [Chitinophagaceae bacterium]